jgi:hypothetical protein
MRPKSPRGLAQGATQARAPTITSPITGEPFNARTCDGTADGLLTLQVIRPVPFDFF